MLAVVGFLYFFCLSFVEDVSGSVGMFISIVCSCSFLFSPSCCFHSMPFDPFVFRFAIAYFCLNAWSWCYRCWGYNHAISNFANAKICRSKFLLSPKVYALLAIDTCVYDWPRWNWQRLCGWSLFDVPLKHKESILDPSQFFFWLRKK